MRVSTDQCALKRLRLLVGDALLITRKSLEFGHTLSQRVSREGRAADRGRVWLTEA
jgi:hypothetical protein